MNVLVIGKYNDAIQRVTDLFEGQSNTKLELVGATSSEKEALSLIDEKDPQAIILALKGGDLDLFEIASRLYKYKPQIITFVYAASIDENVYTQSIACGAKFVGNYPDDFSTMESKMTLIASEEEDRRTFLKEEKRTTIEGSRIVAVYGAKSSIGVTTTAVNLAISLAKNKKMVALLDMDSMFGDVCSFMDLEPKKSMEKICQDFDKTPTINELSPYLTIHSSGVHVIAAPFRPELSDYIEPKKILDLIAMMTSYYDYIILDMPAGLSDMNIELFKIATYIDVITVLEINQLKNTKAAVSTLNEMPFDLQPKVKMIVNRVGKKETLSLKDVHDIIPCPIVAKIPSDYNTAINSANRGVPVIINSPKCGITKAILELTKFTLAKDITDFDIWNVHDEKLAAYYDSLSNENQVKKLKGGKHKWGF